MFRGRGKNKRTALIFSTLLGEFKLKDLLSYTGMPKATYMYWQKRIERVNSDKGLEEKILKLRKDHKDYGYRRLKGVPSSFCFDKGTPLQREPEIYDSEVLNLL